MDKLNLPINGKVPTVDNRYTYQKHHRPAILCPLLNDF